LLFQPLTSQADNQNFWATLFGDCNGSWQPPSGGGAVLRRQRHTAVRLGRSHPNHDGRLRLPVYVDTSHPIDNLDVTLRYNARYLAVRAVRPTDPHALVVFNADRRGVLRIALAGGEPIPKPHG